LFATSKLGAAVLVILTFITLNSVIHVIESTLHIGIINKATLYDNGMGDQCACDRAYQDNINSKSYRNNLCYPSMDIVYTWVNGSDPLHQRDLKLYTDIEHGIIPTTTKSPTHTTTKSAHAKTGKQHQNKNHHRKLHAVTTTTTESAPKVEDESGSNRFRDNEELRFSLRSLEQHAGWVRNVYIVTNGQVPYWLDTSNPRVKIIKHSDIFQNQTHLPTFSSPAIESHIHRIPGLSDKFIYLNDDVMFGNNVLPEDFYTHSDGQKVFLTWDVPDCSPGCSSSWIGDGYCDLACNTTSCGFDGGDCIGPNVRTTSSSSSNSWASPYSSNAWSSPSGSASQYCSPSCPTSWIGDRFCDNPCNNIACGFDGGDCAGVSNMTQLLHFDITSTTKSIHIAHDTPSLLLRLTPLFGGNDTGAKITSGTHDNDKVVRTSTISQKMKTLVMTFYKEKSNEDVEIDIQGTDASGSSVNALFTIHVGSNATTVAPKKKSSPVIQKKSGKSPVKSSVDDIKKKQQTPTPTPTLVLKDEKNDNKQRGVIRVAQE